MDTNNSLQNSINLWTLCTNQNSPSTQLENSLDPLQTAKSLVMQIYWELEQEIQDVETQPGPTKSSKSSLKFQEWLKKSITCDTTEVAQMSLLFQNNYKRYSQAKDEIDDIKNTILQLSRGHEGLMDIVGNDGQQNPADGFMYKDVEDYDLKLGIRSHAKCLNCGSINTKQISLISHSCSFDALQQLFTLRLTSLKGKRLLDIGSGMGSIIFAAYALSEASTITGIELNPTFCQMVSKVILKHRMDRVQVIHGNLKDYPQLFKDSNVIIFNNSFQYFVSKHDQIVLWQFIKNNIKSGSILVTNPSLNKLLAPLQPQIGIKVQEWVTPFKFPEEEAFHKMVALTVIKKPDESFCIYNVI